MFGKVSTNSTNMKKPFYPRSTYGISKVAGFDLTRNYREAYNFFVVVGYYLIMASPLEEVLNLSLEKLLMQFRIKLDCKKI